MATSRILILGASGMLGSTLFRAFSREQDLSTYGTIRDSKYKNYFTERLHDFLIPDVHVTGETGLLAALAASRPDVVINCIGIIKQLPSANDHVQSLEINALFPHRLAKYCDAIGARLIHFSTDCVFSGSLGQYRENHFPDADDLYGRTKLLGEVGHPNCLTLRTSIIGHEVNSSKSLIDWFLTQSGQVRGFTNAIFSGMPTIEIARVLRDFVLPNPTLSGLYHLSASPINKFDLLSLVGKAYNKTNSIVPDGHLSIDRSLDSSRFQDETGFRPKAWPELIENMRNEYLLSNNEES